MVLKAGESEINISSVKMSLHGWLTTRPLTGGLEWLSRHKIFKFNLQAVNEYSDVFLIFFLIFRIFIFYSIGNVEPNSGRLSALVCYVGVCSTYASD